MTDIDAVRDVLEGFTPISDEVPEPFAEFVAERIAARPSPTPAPPPADRSAEIVAKLDEILSLLRGGAT